MKWQVLVYTVKRSFQVKVKKKIVKYILKFCIADYIAHVFYVLMAKEEEFGTFLSLLQILIR